MDRVAVVFIFVTLVAVSGSGKFITNSMTYFFAFFGLKRFNCNRETLQNRRDTMAVSRLRSMLTNANKNLLLVYFSSQTLKKKFFDRLLL